jgi:predicted AlkP superfamily pyrophosphatase or phosphodiesterase
MMKELEPQAGPYETNLDNAFPGDWARTHYAEAIIRRKHARLLTVHLAALDSFEHESGPFSPQANAAPEEIDRMVGTLDQAMRGETRNTAICIVSDHGFASAAHPANGISHVLGRAEIAAIGSAANAQFAVDMKPGFSIGGALDGPAVLKIKPGGTHGYSPAHPEMPASFLIAGPGIRQNLDPGEIDMRSIAATLASSLGVSLTTANVPGLNIAEKH